MAAIHSRPKHLPHELSKASNNVDMTPLQRFAAYDAGKPIDRLPTVPVLTNTTARVIGARVSEFAGNAALTAHGQIQAYRLFGYDVIRVMNDLFFMAEAMGAKVRHPIDETAYLDEPALKSRSDIDSLNPAHPQKAWQLRSLLEATEIILDRVGSEVPVTVGVVCPFTNSSHLVGANQLARLTLKDPAAVHRLCRISLEAALAYAEAILDLGATPSLTEPMGSGSVISPRAFDEFVLPYLKPLTQLVHSRNKKVTLHICGDTSHVWNSMVDAGADCISIDDEANLHDAKHAVGEHVRLMGNVRPASIMLQGSPSDVREAVFDCIALAHDNPRGYIIAAGCSLPTETPFANIWAMLDAAHEIGFPVNLPGIPRIDSA